MNYNPHEVWYKALTVEISNLERAIQEENEGLTWYNTFNADDVHSELTALHREANTLEDERGEIATIKTDHQARVNAIKEATRLGWNPGHWFSLSRLKWARELKKEVRALRIIVERDRELARIAQSLNEQRSAREEKLQRYRAFDTLEAQAKIVAKKLELEKLRSELDEVHAKKIGLDQELEPHLKKLRHLTRKADFLEADISTAEEFEYRLSNSQKGAVKAAIHQDCFHRFGESSPARVISAKRSELDRINRDITKIDERLRLIARRSQRRIKSLVIDGSNLCYEENRFIGLGALKAVTRELSVKYTIRIVFDASIRRKLKMADDEIRAELGGRTIVHVCASGQRADETVLDEAPSADTYIISNDRFAEYHEKAPVREKRVLTHEILNGKIFIRDLDFQCQWLGVK